MDFKTLTNKQIADEIAEVVGRIHGYFDWRAQLHFLLQLPDLPEKHYQHTPLALSLRAIFDHVTGANPQPETVRDSCQLVCETLFVAPGNAGAEYSIPESFWETLTGQAIAAVISRRPGLADGDLISGETVEEAFPISRQAINDARLRGELAAVESTKGSRPVFLYRVGDVREWLLGRKNN